MSTLSFGRVAPFLAFGAVLIGTAMIASTYSVFNQTWDEPAHIACGMEWLDKGEFQYEALHPPLARVAVALGPYLAGLRSHGNDSVWEEGNLILATNGQYQRNLALARVGVLPFFWLCCGLIWYLMHSYMGSASALASVFLFTTTPTVLAHSSLATTDLPLAAMFLLALTAWLRWRENATPASSIYLGIALGLLLVTKFSAIPFLGLTLAAAVVIDRHAFREVHHLTRQLFAACSAAMLTVWATYRFSSGPVAQPSMLSHPLNRVVGEAGRLHDAVYFALQKVPVPAPEFFRGICSLLAHNSVGREAYFLGRVSSGGHWFFFPVLLVSKLTIPMLILVGIGAFRALSPMGERHRQLLTLLLLAVICPLLVASLSRFNELVPFVWTDFAFT
jgi:4-amino-4-deoxy-L-arabinose transferase-like glycosyltransferase